jgi:hypothetical protein
MIFYDQKKNTSPWSSCICFLGTLPRAITVCHVQKYSLFERIDFLSNDKNFFLNRCISLFLLNKRIFWKKIASIWIILHEEI